jgi:hypothetical protein
MLNPARTFVRDVSCTAASPPMPSNETFTPTPMFPKFPSRPDAGADTADCPYPSEPMNKLQSNKVARPSCFMNFLFST